MVRDPAANFSIKLETNEPQLVALGWQSFFADQITSLNKETAIPVRVTQVHRNTINIMGVDIDRKIPAVLEVAVGDWLLLDTDDPRNSFILKRKSLVKRRAPGHDRKEQLIAANLDTAFIVSSCNQDFNIARLERYVAMAHDAEVAPVIILTKNDLSDDPQSYATRASSISSRVPVICLDGRHSQARLQLAPWCALGQTVAFLGSSGVGKSTLANTLSGNNDIETQDVRAADDRGRHTTTRRQLYILEGGCAIVDTPGMRELQLTDVAVGLKETFADLHALTQSCRFNDCAHDKEPGCAIIAAIKSKEIDVARVQRWVKLVTEDQENTSALAQKSYRDKGRSKLTKGKKKGHK
ncbi:MAG: ribosome small subunit-dependent GTPase A, partial [Planktomarina sp.]|nr:ribosome small subunit-dependent GTPase A [Planktomarina sp.]